MPISCLLPYKKLLNSCMRSCIQLISLHTRSHPSYTGIVRTQLNITIANDATQLREHCSYNQKPLLPSSHLYLTDFIPPLKSSFIQIFYYIP
jgi:hypothetical protein